MRTILRDGSLDMRAELERLIAALQATPVVPELAAYRDRVVQACLDMQGQIDGILHNLNLERDDLLPEILSETQRLNRQLRLYNQRFAGPALRGLEADRLSLRVIAWLHAAHEQTRDVPAGISTEAFGIWPQPPHPVVYLLPASAQHGLLYQPLFFHEFGHLLYACHAPEMDDLVRDLQERIADLLGPAQVRSDDPYQVELKRAIIARTWYEWAQELFCDAVGLVIGGPAFLRAFDRFLRIGPRTEYHCPPLQLGFRPHPVTWLRAHLLARRARELCFEELAGTVERGWATVAAALDITEDYYGFYERAFLPAIWETLEAMLVETEPYRFTARDLGEEEWTPGSTPVHLVNQAWQRFQDDRESYAQWEHQVIAAFLSTPQGE